MNKRSTSFMSLLLDDLADDAEAAAYLSAAWEESTQMFLTAVKDVLQAREITAVARKSGVCREHLYRTFTKKGNPTIATLRSVLRAVGLDFPRVSTLQEIEAALSGPQNPPITSRRRTYKGRRRKTVKNDMQYNLPFGESVVAQVGHTPVTPVVPCRAASDNYMSTTLNSTKPITQQNQESPVPPAWMIEQFSAAGANSASDIGRNSNG